MLPYFKFDSSYKPVAGVCEAMIENIVTKLAYQKKVLEDM